MKNNLKFRIWHFKSKRFINPPEDIYIKYNGNLVFDDFNIGICDLTYPEDYIIQLWTGLKDQNGKEIYEGDFLQFDPDITSLGKSCVWTNWGHVWRPELYDEIRVSYNHEYSEVSDSWNELIGNYYRNWNGKTHLTYEIVGNELEDHPPKI